MVEEPKPRGRPPKDPGKVKQAPLNMRTDPRLRAMIEEAADANQWSLTQEVETRLRTSFILQDVLGGQHIFSFAHMLCLTIQMIEQETGKRWIDDFLTFERVRAAAERLLKWKQPKADANRKDMAALTKAQDVAIETDKAASAAVQAVSDYRNELVRRYPKRSPGGFLAGLTPDPAPTADELAVLANLADKAIAAQQKAAAAGVKWRAKVDAAMQPHVDAKADGTRLAEQSFELFGPR